MSRKRGKMEKNKTSKEKGLNNERGHKNALIYGGVNSPLSVTFGERLPCRSTPNTSDGAICLNHVNISAVPPGNRAPTHWDADMSKTYGTLIYPKGTRGVVLQHRRRSDRLFWIYTFLIKIFLKIEIGSRKV